MPTFSASGSGLIETEREVGGGVEEDVHEDAGDAASHGGELASDEARSSAGASMPFVTVSSRAARV